MKKKYKVLFLIFILLFIGIVSIFFFKKNKTYVNTVESFSKEYLISYESGYKKTAICDRYYDGFGTKVYKMSEVSEGYPMYLIDGCAVGLSWYLSNISDKETACNAQKEYAQKNIASSSDVGFYNSSCGSLTGKLEVSYDGMTCDDAKDLIESKYIDYYGLYDNWFKTNCSGTSINIDTSKTYYSNSSCESLRFNNKKTGILKYNDSKNTCGYDLFYVDGSAVELDYYINKGGDKNEYCSYMKERLQNNYVGNLLAVKDYNNHCSLKTDTTEFINGVTAITEKSDSCANYINKYNGVLAPTIALKKGEYTAGNACDYTVYYYKGQPYAFDDLVELDDVTDNEKKNLCNARYDQINGTNNDYDVFNSYCGSVIGKSLNYEETIDVVFQANDGYGLECRDFSFDDTGGMYRSYTSAKNECTYRFKESLKGQTISLNYSELPKSSSLVQNTTGAKFNGWKSSTSTECSTKSGSVTFTLPNGENAERITYSPCYSLEEKKSLGYTLYQKCDGNYIGDSVNGQTNVNNSAILKSSVSATKLYATTDSSSNIDQFKINKYCTISCTETVNYNYPTIFETVKSGTYFELLSYPEVKSNLTCTENFNYDNWRATYDSQIEKEKKAYVNKKNSENINNLDFSKGDACSSECTSSCTNGGCCGYKYYYTYSATTSIYSYNSSNGSVSSSSKTFSYCEKYGNASNTISSAKATYGVNSGNVTYYSGLYDTAKSERVSLETANEVCVNAMKKTTVSTDNFYKTTPNLYFYYESDVDENGNSLNGDSTNYHKDTLKASNAYKKDTDIHDWNVNTFYKEEVPIEISYDSINETFNSLKTNNSFLRTVTRNYVYNKSDSHDEYYAKNQSGEITTSSGNSIYLGYVYPVSLTLSGSRKVYFSLDYNTNLSWGAKEVLGTEGTSVSDKNVYQCSYDISNDIIVLDTTTLTEDDYKKNFYIRSISTQDVDPNNRFDNGLLGANWSSKKGQTLINEIEKRAENNNTYNPDNLEYSFTLNATTIEAVKAYNATTKYDDFDLECNNVGGECTSKFLEALSKSKLNGKSLTGVNAYIKRKSDPTWKYYIGDKWYTLKSITDYKNYSGDCSSYIGNKKNYYECLYRNVNEGVLP